MFLSDVSCFLDSSLNILAFGNSYADASFFITDNHQRLEAEAAAAFDYARNAVNCDCLLFEDFLFGWFVARSTTTISLPRPFILTKGSEGAGFMGPYMARSA